MSRANPKWFDLYIPEEVSDSTLFKFKVIYGKDKSGNDRFVEVDMRADLGIDYTAIQQQLEDTPQEFAYWASIYSEVKLRTAILDRKIKARRGIVANQLMQDAINHGIKVTDKQISTCIESDVELNKLEMQLALAKKHEGKLYFMVDALRMKADNLRSLSGFAKIEMGQQGQ